MGPICVDFVEVQVIRRVDVQAHAKYEGTGVVDHVPTLLCKTDLCFGRMDVKHLGCERIEHPLHTEGPQEREGNNPVQDVICVVGPDVIHDVAIQLEAIL